MASKRKFKHPSKLIEEKRQCLTWNLYDACQNAQYGVQPSSSSSLEEVPWKDQKNKSLSPSIDGAARASEPVTAKAKGRDDCLPLLSLKIECSKCIKSKPVALNSCIGPKVFQLFLTKEGIERDWKLKFNLSNNGSISECFCGKRDFLLKVYHDYGASNSFEEDRQRAEIHLLTKVLFSEEMETSEWTWDTKRNYYSLQVWSGYLVLPRTVLSSISKMAQDKQLAFVVNPGDLANTDLCIHARIVENKLGMMASDDTTVNKMSYKLHMKNILSYFYGIYDEVVYDNSEKKFCFTANEIPALYNYIKEYHSRSFSIELTDKESLIEDDYREEVASSASDETRSCVTSLDQGTSLESFSESVSVKSDIMDDYQNEDDIQKFEIDEINGTANGLVISNQSIYGIKVDLLIPKLRKYQYTAVQWMIFKENETEYELGPTEHVLWTKLTVFDEESIYYNRFSSRVCSKLHILPLPQGGILADEMGLGKTVEVLALILKNGRGTKFSLSDFHTLDPVETELTKIAEDSDQELPCCFCGRKIGYIRRNCFKCKVPMHLRCDGTMGKNVRKVLCPICGTKEVMKTHCTLIISPATIVNQWIEEIQKHVEKGTITYFLYLGVGRGGYIQPSVLAEYDVIITTYETLNSDFHHVKTEEGRDRKLRNRKKYMALPSPLVYLEFWRVCLDEAQMIQCPTTKLAEMALRISAVHRWCVTGTPLQRGLEDIYGMLLFTGVYPYCIKTWWTKLLYQPLMHGNSKPLFDILARVMWRTEKKDVLDQINLPDQTETLKLLKFTPVEWQFYKRQEEVCTATALKEIEKWTEKETILSTLDKSSLHSLLAPLLRLRQACCHPRAVRDGVLGIHKSHLTMDKLLEGLKAKAKLDCEEAHRQVMCAINGLAAIDIIEGKFEDAVTKYREAIQSSAAHKDVFRTDLLQKLHTVKNLSFALTKSTSCSHALSDDNLDTEAKELAKEYMKKSELQLQTAEEKVGSMEESFEPFRGTIDWKNPWWIELIHDFKSTTVPGREEGLITRVKQELSTQLHTCTIMGSRFNTIDGLQYLLLSKITALTDQRQKLKESLAELKKEPSREMVLQTAECCLRNVEENALRRCEFCKVDNLFTEYEGMLFHHRGMKGNGPIEDEDGKRYGGLRAETELDVVLKTLYAIARHNPREEVIDQAKAHMGYMDLVKQEFKALRNLWFALHKRISALDELEMSSIRLRLRYENEENKESYIIDVHEIELQRFKLTTDKTVADHRLKKKKGQLFYLTNLEKAQSRSQDSNPETCPICEETLGIEWAVFSCGHCFCCQCTTRFEQQHGIRFRKGGAKLNCPMCREPTLSEEISFVVMSDGADSDDDEIQVKGNYSVKIEAIVRKILEIKKSDPVGKIIVFSTWQDVLSIISDALVENEVEFNYAVGSGKKFQDSLAAFKSLPSIRVLLLPLKLGSKGLNIIEATHVILVEPTLNPANELQAVGRIHRIGQTKPTFVHRFIVRDTVEERIQNLLKTKSGNDLLSNNDASSALTIRDLSSLLV